MERSEGYSSHEGIHHHHHHSHLIRRITRHFRDLVLIGFAVLLTILLLSMFGQQEKVDPEIEKRILKLLKDREEQKRLEKMAEEAEKRSIDTEAFIK